MELIQEPSIWDTLIALVQTLWTLVLQLGALGFHWILWILWGAFWLLGVNAKKMRYVLLSGGWAPALLLIVLIAIVWSRLVPGPCPCQWIKIPNFWWQLSYVSMLAAIAAIAAWLQTVFHWTPHDINLDPPADGHGHGHAHH